MKAIGRKLARPMARKLARPLAHVGPFAPVGAFPYDYEAPTGPPLPELLGASWSGAHIGNKLKEDSGNAAFDMDIIGRYSVRNPGGSGVLELNELSIDETVWAFFFELDQWDPDLNFNFLIGYGTTKRIFSVKTNTNNMGYRGEDNVWAYWSGTGNTTPVNVDDFRNRRFTLCVYSDGTNIHLVLDGVSYGYITPAIPHIGMSEIFNGYGGAAYPYQGSCNRFQYKKSLTTFEECVIFHNGGDIKDPLGKYELCEGGEEMICYDSSGRGNHATLTEGIVRYWSKNGVSPNFKKGFSFKDYGAEPSEGTVTIYTNDRDDYINTGVSCGENSTVEILGRFIDDPDRDYKYIGAFESGQPNRFYFGIASNKWRIAIGDGSVDSAAGLIDDLWHIFKIQNKRFYIDGVEIINASHRLFTGTPTEFFLYNINNFTNLHSGMEIVYAIVDGKTFTPQLDGSYKDELNNDYFNRGEASNLYPLTAETFAATFKTRIPAVTSKVDAIGGTLQHPPGNWNNNTEVFFQPPAEPALIAIDQPLKYLYGNITKEPTFLERGVEWQAPSQVSGLPILGHLGYAWFRNTASNEYIQMRQPDILIQTESYTLRYTILSNSGQSNYLYIENPRKSSDGVTGHLINATVGDHEVPGLDTFASVDLVIKRAQANTSVKISNIQLINEDGSGTAPNGLVFATRQENAFSHNRFYSHAGADKWSKFLLYNDALTPDQNAAVLNYVQTP